MPSKPAPITMDAVYTAPGYLFRRMQQIAVALFMEECKAFDLTPVQYGSLIAIHTHPGIDATRTASTKTCAHSLVVSGQRPEMMNPRSEPRA